MNNNAIFKNYVSEIDQLLQKFDQKHPKLSDSQLKERTKHRRISLLRDKTQNDDHKTTLWEGF